MGARRPSPTGPAYRPAAAGREADPATNRCSCMQDPEPLPLACSGA